MSVGCNAIVTQSPFVRVYTKKGRAFHQKFYDNSIKFHKTDRQTSLSKRFRHFQHFWRQTFCAISFSVSDIDETFLDSTVKHPLPFGLQKLGVYTGLKFQHRTLRTIHWMVFSVHRSVYSYHFDGSNLENFERVWKILVQKLYWPFTSEFRNWRRKLFEKALLGGDSSEFQIPVFSENRFWFELLDESGMVLLKNSNLVMVSRWIEWLLEQCENHLDRFFSAVMKL